METKRFSRSPLCLSAWDFLPKFCLLFLLLCAAPGLQKTQAQASCSEAEFVAAVLANPVHTQGAALALKQQQQLLPSSVALDRLRLSYATDPYDPTELALEQDIAFPSVYVRRRQLQQAQVGYAQTAQSLNRYELKRRARELYAQLQWLLGRQEALRIQDSLFEKIASSARRSFDAGQVNALEKQFAANRYGNAHNAYLRALEQAAAAQMQAGLLAGKTQAIVPVAASISGLEVPENTDSAVAFPSLLLLQQNVLRSRRDAALQRAEAWPGLSAGVGFGLGDKPKERPVGIRLGLTLPIYFWQSTARIAAARTGVRLAEAQQQEGRQEWTIRVAAAEADRLRAREGLRYYENQALPRAQEIIHTADRLFAAGQVNYSDYLRNAAEAFDNMLARQQALYDYQLALINLQYLKGSL